MLLQSKDLTAFLRFSKRGVWSLGSGSMFKYTPVSKEEEPGLNTRDYTEEQLQRLCRSSPGERRVVGPLTRNLRAAGSA